MLTVVVRFAAGRAARYAEMEAEGAAMRIVAKALEAFVGDWHWVELHNAELVEPAERVYRISGADTLCGIHLSGPNTARLHDTGAPPEPDCEACLQAGDDGGMAEAVAAAEEIVTAVAVPVRR
ncbi:MAG: hypothetical protein GEU80_16405 [Dehalococcoidia bacterium]|nr:hypothetical protein [Dehalococcoidia bacterium]